MPNGNVVGCGCIDWLQKYVIGNTYKNSISEIWTSDAANKFRHSFSEKKKIFLVFVWNVPYMRHAILEIRNIKNMFLKWDYGTGFDKNNTLITSIEIF